MNLLGRNKTGFKVCLLLLNLLAVSWVQADIDITTIEVDSTGSVNQVLIPVTFGQVFQKGDLPAGYTITARDTSSGEQFDTQVDIKASHNDDSLRHGVISFHLPSLVAGTTRQIALERVVATTPSALGSIQDLLDSSFEAGVSLDISGTAYSASATDALINGYTGTWLSGNQVMEWQGSLPLKSSAGVVHPHLQVYFHVRAYNGLGNVRVDYVLENNWAYIADPHHIQYDNLALTLNNQIVYQNTSLIHLKSARWRKTFWSNSEPSLHVAHDSAYLIGTQAVPNYDPGLINDIPEVSLQSMADQWQSEVKSYRRFTTDSYSYTYDKIDIMGPGPVVETYMPTTGGRADIGPLPRWSARYLLSMDKRAKQTTLGIGNLAGSWPVHYRDQATGLPLSIDDYPYATTNWSFNTGRNPTTGQNEHLPLCAGEGEIACKPAPYTADTQHQPSWAYVPYLVTGDFYYLEELVFWANSNLISYHPEYRDLSKGIVKSDELRGQAWSLRTLARAAFITPDDYPMKGYFNEKLNNNLNYYNDTYTHNSAANKLGIITNGYAVGYDEYRGTASWQEAFFTWTIGHVYELGYEKAAPLLAWKAKFFDGLLAGSDFCWNIASAYFITVRDTRSSPFYDSFGEVYEKTLSNSFGSANLLDVTCNSPEMASLLNIQVGEMIGYASSPTGYPANIQPAIAVAKMSGTSESDAAWSQFDSRSIKPDYRDYPNFAIVPRSEYVTPTPPKPPEPGTPSGGETPSTCSGQVYNSLNGTLHIPYLTYETGEGTEHMWANLEFLGNAGNMQFEVVDFGLLSESDSARNCIPATLSGEWALFLPGITLAETNLWARLEYTPQSASGVFTLKEHAVIPSEGGGGGNGTYGDHGNTGVAKGVNPNAAVDRDALLNLKSGQWYEISGSSMSVVFPDPKPPGVDGPSATMTAWSGGAFDNNTDQLIIWGGGHTDYGGNEVYGFDVYDLIWRRLNDSSTDYSIIDTAYLADGLPNSRHTYDSLEYVPALGSICAFGAPAIYRSAGRFKTTDCFDATTKIWTRKAPVPGVHYGVMSAYDSASGRVWYHPTSKEGVLHSYDPVADKWTTHGNKWTDNYIEHPLTATIDPVRRKFVAVGNGTVHVWDLSASKPIGELVSTTGDTAIVNAWYPGVDYDPIRGEVVAWHGGADVYLLNLDTLVWNKQPLSGDNQVIPDAAEPRGTNGRFRYVPSLDLYIAVNRVSGNVYFYKM